MPPDIELNDISIQDRESDIRRVFLDRVWTGTLVVALLGVPASVARSFFTGWKSAYLVHLVGLIVVMVAYVMRQKLSFAMRANIVVVLLDLVAVTGLINFGLLGSAWWWLLVSGLLTSTFYGPRAGLLHSVVAMVIISAIAVGHTSGVLALGFDANSYVLQYSSWLTMLLGPALLTLFVFWALTTFQDATRLLLQEVDNRRAHETALLAQLKQAQAENKTLQSFIPICAHCKMIRDDKGFWMNVEGWMQRNADMQFTHALCPPCGTLLYGDLWEQAMETAKSRSTGSHNANNSSDNNNTTTNNNT